MGIEAELNNQMCRRLYNCTDSVETAKNKLGVGWPEILIEEWEEEGMTPNDSRKDAEGRTCLRRASS